MRRRGFTLVEMLVVLAIVAALLALLVPVVSHIHQGAQASACISNLRQIGAGLNGYLGDHDLTMPKMLAGRSRLSDDGPVLETVLAPYVKSAAVFACPADTRFAATTGTSYYWNVALNEQRLGSLNFLKLSEEDSKIPMISDKEGFHPYIENKVNILYADGHATKDLKFRTD